jgi:hypothetical protein
MNESKKLGAEDSTPEDEREARAWRPLFLHDETF